ncbi:unnamed protein product [Aphanomyces euteiches]|uniref:Major facilitator superfamily (MFS) profile domain-containing protein n=1 Tax=Aphanomyces euteiches TaxID=100861 RepID=A0A6G0X4G9_9STRA|nr:hypothetical protein Ae201684_008683 [Aphanomyces euteiches]KAH9085742.1 hypothetical protein Ae201684P_005445 [Aphanomyces euteiches]KAH9135710.1 hypothetical protein AeRB84_018926 [Aphanomyces euteiches]
MPESPRSRSKAIPPPYDTFILDAVDVTGNQRRVNVLFSLIGFSYLFALDALFQPVDYWRLVFPTFNVEFEISWVYNCASATTLFLLVLSGAVPKFVQRIVGCYVIIIVCLVSLPASHFVLSSETQNLVVVLGSTALASMAISTVDSTMFALGSLFSPSAIEHLQLGMGFALLTSALYRVFSKAVFAIDMVIPATTLYFGLAVATVSMGLTAFIQLERLSSTREAIHHSRRQVISLSVWPKIWFHECLVALSYSCSSVVYPGVVSSIPSYNFTQLDATGWWPLMLMLVYAIGEACGRFCVRWRFGLTSQSIAKLFVVRLALVPLVVSCAMGVLFTHDMISLVIVLLSGLSSGYVGTLAIVLVTDCVDPDERSATGMFSSLSINVGLLTGATFALAAVRL